MSDELDLGNISQAKPAGEPLVCLPAAEVAELRARLVDAEKAARKTFFEHIHELYFAEDGTLSHSLDDKQRAAMAALSKRAQAAEAKLAGAMALLSECPQWMGKQTPNKHAENLCDDLLIRISAALASMPQEKA